MAGTLKASSNRGDRIDGSVERLRSDIARGRTGEKADWPDLAAAPLGTDDEAAGAAVGASTEAPCIARKRPRPAYRARSGMESAQHGS